MINTTRESDNLSFHKIKVKNRTLEIFVDSQAYEYLVTEDSEMKITLEFPRSLRDDSIISEVKSILKEILNEYLEKSII